MLPSLTHPGNCNVFASYILSSFPETPKKVTGMVSVKLPNFKVKPRPNTKITGPELIESSPEPTTHNAIKGDECQTTKLNVEGRPNMASIGQQKVKSGPELRVHSADTEGIINEDQTTVLVVDHQPNTRTIGQQTTKSSPQSATRHRKPKNTRIAGRQTNEAGPQSSTHDPNKTDQPQTSKPTDSIPSRVSISVTSLVDTAQNSCEDTPVENCDSNLKDATDSDVPIKGTSSTNETEPHAALTNQCSKEISNTDQRAELISERDAVPDTNSVPTNKRTSALSPSTKSTQPAGKSAISLPWYRTENHITQSLKSDNMSSPSKTVVPDEKSESTSHQNNDSSNNDKMLLFVTEQPGEFKLSDDLRRNLVISTAKSLKVHLTKVSNASPICVPERQSTDSATDSDSSCSPLKNPRKSTRMTNTVQQNKRSSTSLVSENDSVVGSSPTRQLTPEKCNIDSPLTDEAATPPKIMRTPTRKSRSSPRKSQTSPLKNHSTTDRPITVESSLKTQPIQNCAQSQTVISDEQLTEDLEPSFKMLSYENVTIRSRKPHRRVLQDDSIISQSIAQRFCESDSEIEVVRDSPTSGKTDGCFFVDSKNESSRNDHSLNDGVSAVMSIHSSPDIYENSRLDQSSTCRSGDHEIQPLTPVTPIIAIDEQQQLKKRSADDETITLHRSPSVELVTTQNRNCDVIDDLHEASPLLQSNALSAIRENYSDSDGMQSSVTLVDDIIPRSTDEQESDGCLFKQVSSYVTICYEKLMKNSNPRSSDPNRGRDKFCVVHILYIRKFPE